MFHGFLIIFWYNRFCHIELIVCSLFQESKAHRYYCEKLQGIQQNIDSSKCADVIVLYLLYKIYKLGFYQIGQRTGLGQFSMNDV